jgi:hypothetical protein
MRQRRVVVASLLALAIVGRGGAAVVAAQAEDPCDRLQEVEDAEVDGFVDQQRAQAEVLAACYEGENEQNLKGS